MTDHPLGVEASLCPIMAVSESAGAIGAESSGKGSRCRRGGRSTVLEHENLLGLSVYGTSKHFR